MSKYILDIKGKKNSVDNLTMEWNNAWDAMRCKRTAEQLGYKVEVKKVKGDENHEKTHRKFSLYLL